MIRFRYDNIEADKLILEFKCKKCLLLTKTESLIVPEVDWDNFATKMKKYRHECQCGACYSISLFNSIYDGYGEIHGIDGKEIDVYVHEVPYIPYDKETLLADTISSYSRIDSIVEKIDGLSNDDKSYIYCLLFSNLITILDSFIKIYTEPIILGNTELIDRFSFVFRMSKGEVEEKKQKIVNFYKLKSFQSITNQKKLFKDVFEIDIEIDDRIEHYVAIRDVIIHRNAIDSQGYVHRIKKSQLLKALDVIKDYIRHIFRALDDFETDLIVGRIINRNRE